MLAFIYLGLGNITQNLYVVPVTEHFGFSRSDFSLIFSIVSAIGIVANLTYNKVYKKFGIRFIVGTGTLSIAVAYFIYYKALSLSAFYIGAILFGVGMVFTSTLTFSILINNWFTEKKGLILGLIFAGSGLGGSVFSPLVANLISNYSFSRAYLTGSIVFFILSLPISLMIKESDKRVEEIEIKQGDNIMTTKKTVRDLFKEPHIMSGMFCLFLMGFLIAPLLNITPAHMTDRNFDYIFASKISGGIMLILALAKVLLGMINDRFGIRVSISLGLITFILSALLLLFMNTEVIAWLYSLTYGISLATLSVLIPLFILAVTGEEDFGTLIGIGVSMMSAGVAAGTPAISLSYDLTGTYDLVLVIFALLGLAAYLLTMLTIKRSSDVQRNLKLIKTNYDQDKYEMEVTEKNC